jgi:hypothetical protein
MNEYTILIRKLTIELLDDGHGINESAFLELHPLLTKTSNEDIIPSIKVVEGRFYLEEDRAMELRNAIIGTN